MKTFSTLIIAFFLQFSAFSQDTLLTYMDAGWKKTKKSKAEYYRKTVKKSPTYYEVFDYYMSGTLQMTGCYSNKKLTLREGVFTYYDEQGRKTRQFTCVHDLIEGSYQDFYENGKLKDDQLYAAGKRTGTNTYYFESGAVSSVEQYRADSLLSLVFYEEDGSRNLTDTSIFVPAAYPGGQAAMKKFLANNLVYPESALQANRQGRCYVRFVVNSTGIILEITVPKGVKKCPECDAEAMRVVDLMPRWTPSKMHNRPVDSYFNLPVTFKLQ